MDREDIFERVSQIESRDDMRKLLSNLHYTHFHMLDKYKKALALYELSFTQLNVLHTIAVYFPDGASLEEIKKLVLEPNSDVSRTVTRLAEKGFVKKVPDPKNGRKLSIMITEKGDKTVKKILVDKRLDYTSEISLEEAGAFVNVLNKLRA